MNLCLLIDSREGNLTHLKPFTLPSSGMIIAHFQLRMYRKMLDGRYFNLEVKVQCDLVIMHL